MDFPLVTGEEVRDKKTKIRLITSNLLFSNLIFADHFVVFGALKNYYFQFSTVSVLAVTWNLQ